MYEFVLFLSVICLIGVTLTFVRSPAFSLFHPLTFYLAFHAVVFVFRPILSYLLGFEQIYLAYQFTPSPSDKPLQVLDGTKPGAAPATSLLNSLSFSKSRLSIFSCRFFESRPLVAKTK